MTLTADRLPDSAPLPRDLLVQVRDSAREADRRRAAVLELALEFAHASPALPGQETWEPDRGALVAGGPDRPARRGGARVDRDPGACAGTPRRRSPPPTTCPRPPGRRCCATSWCSPIGRPRSGQRCGRAGCRPAGPAGGAGAAWPAGRRVPLRRHRAGRAPHRGRRRSGPSSSTGWSTTPCCGCTRSSARSSSSRRSTPATSPSTPRRSTTPASASWTPGGLGRPRAFDETLSAVAHALAQLPDHEHDSLDVRRSIALGILADPGPGPALLEGDLEARRPAAAI